MAEEEQKKTRRKVADKIYVLLSFEETVHEDGSKSTEVTGHEVIINADELLRRMAMPGFAKNNKYITLTSEDFKY